MERFQLIKVTVEIKPCKCKVYPEKEHNIFLIVSITARLTSLIFQQYRIGFRLELNKTSVIVNVQTTRSDKVTPLTAIATKSTPIGR